MTATPPFVYLDHAATSPTDPRVVEATGISMMATAQGADHTAGNLPRLKTREMDLESLVSQSLAHQARVATRGRERLSRLSQGSANHLSQKGTGMLEGLPLHGSLQSGSELGLLGGDRLTIEDSCGALQDGRDQAKRRTRAQRLTPPDQCLEGVATSR